MANAVTYKGGRILTEIRPMALWASITWPDSTESTWNIQGQRCLLDQFFSDIVNSKYITALSSAFSAGGHTIGAGPFLGTTGLQINPVRKGVVDDGEIQAALADAVTNNLIAWPTQDTCYFIVILAVRRRVRGGAIGPEQLLVGVGLRARVPGRELATARRHRTGHRK